MLEGLAEMINPTTVYCPVTQRVIMPTLKQEGMNLLSAALESSSFHLNPRSEFGVQHVRCFLQILGKKARQTAIG